MPYRYSDEYIKLTDAWDVFRDKLKYKYYFLPATCNDQEPSPKNLNTVLQLSQPYSEEDREELEQFVAGLDTDMQKYGMHIAKKIYFESLMQLAISVQLVKFIA